MMFKNIKKRVVSIFSKKKEETTFFDYKIGDVSKYCERWNILNPIDRWWRKKHKIAFGSKEHLESNFIDMYIEFKEDELFKSFENQEEYIQNKGKFIRENVEITESQKEESFDDFMKEFDEMDLSQYDS